MKTHIFSAKATGKEIWNILQADLRGIGQFQESHIKVQTVVGKLNALYKLQEEKGLMNYTLLNEFVCINCSNNYNCNQLLVHLIQEHKRRNEVGEEISTEITHNS